MKAKWQKRSNCCINYINVCQASIKQLFSVKRYHISLTMKVHQVHHPRKHMAYMYIILYECQTFVNNSQWHTQSIYMAFEWLVPIKRAKVYVSWPNALTDLSDSASFWQHLHKTKERKYSDNFLSRGTVTLHKHKAVQICSLQKEEHAHNGKFTK